MMKILFLFTCSLQLTFADEDWGYQSGPDELDPSHWYIKYQTCIGNRQSPIDIEKEYVVYNPKLEPLIFIGYDKPIKLANITNEGHTVRIDVPDDSRAYVTSRSLNTTYKLKQFHFHWGHQDDVGSEHVLFGKHFPMEMHMVHSDETVTYDDALLEPFGLLVVSVLFKFGNENLELNRISKHFPIIVDPFKKTVVPILNLDLNYLVPVNAKNYLQYAGSLTTPPCSEAVHWVILTDTGELSHNEMDNFRALKHEVEEADGEEVEKEIEMNDRPMQGIKGRKVELYYDFDEIGTDSRKSGSSSKLYSDYISSILWELVHYLF